MRSSALLAAFVVLAVVLEVVLPGRAVYHAGWYNVALAALAVWAIVRTRSTPLIAFGVGAIALAGIASGLLGPDTRTVIGAPGTSVRADEAGGTLVFPPLHAQPIGAWRYTATASLRRVPRTVIAIEAFDQRGAHLTITQPTGSAFLSPVLLMENTQTIAGFALPYDTFAVPAEHRIVKAVLFSAAQAASIPALSTIHGPVVLFDLEDETGASIPHGIGVAPDDQAVLLGGLRLRASVLSYPAIEVVSIPDLAVVAAGLLAIFIGVLLTRRRAAG
ncbi:MAG: hypothetical protein WBG27_07015 [Candidatus Aquilonibacter sp.]